jgi:hypothetical protein
MVFGSVPLAAKTGAPNRAIPVGLLIRRFTIGIPLLSTAPDCRADSNSSRQLTGTV